MSFGFLILLRMQCVRKQEGTLDAKPLSWKISSGAYVHLRAYGLEPEWLGNPEKTALRVQTSIVQKLLCLVCIVDVLEVFIKSITSS
jgi:hypothetical protein